MTHRGHRFGWAFVLLLALAACGGEGSEDGSSDGGGAQAAEPSKEALLNTLRGALAAIMAENHAEAIRHFVMPKGASADGAGKRLQKMIELKEISGPGIAALQAKGKYGKLADVFPDRGERWAKRMGVDPASCYALSLDPAEVAATWDGKAFRLIRLDDVGKLK